MNRQLNTTVAEDSLSILVEVTQEIGLPHVGIALDYIVHDWTKLKRAAIKAAEPTPESVR